MLPRELEICAETLQACAAAAEGGADRIELCAALAEGGVSPSRGFLRSAVEASPLPIHALLRPRSGNFVYSAAEYRILCADLEDALTSGATGVVLGLLTPAGEIDRPRTADLIRLASGHPVTFHRAFDHTPNLLKSLEVVVDLGCSRILTSGGKPTVMEGFAMLDMLADQAAGRLRVAAGGGVRLANAGRLLGIRGLDLHASLLARPPATEVPPSDPLWDPRASPALLLSASVRILRDKVHST